VTAPAVVERAASERPVERPPVAERAPAVARSYDDVEPDGQLAVLPKPRHAAEPDLDALDAAAYAAAHGLPAPRPDRGHRGGRDGRDNRDHRGRDQQGRGGSGGGQPQAQTPPGDPALQGEGYKAMERVFLRPGAVTRWPLYLRQAKAVLRAGDETFDERRYGFAGLVEALRFGQREGLFRLDRDRQGVLRVYPGQLLQALAGGEARRDDAPADADAQAPLPLAPAPAEPAPQRFIEEDARALAAAPEAIGTEAEVEAEAAEPAAPAPARGKRKPAAARKTAPAKKAVKKAAKAAPRKKAGKKGDA
jgi:hypothetical protein